jgi:hypothetical protein
MSGEILDFLQKNSRPRLVKWVYLEFSKRKIIYFFQLVRLLTLVLALLVIVRNIFNGVIFGTIVCLFIFISLLATVIQKKYKIRYSYLTLTLVVYLFILLNDIYVGY